MLLIHTVSELKLKVQWSNDQKTASTAIAYSRLAGNSLLQNLFLQLPSHGNVVQCYTENEHRDRGVKIIKYKEKSQVPKQFQHSIEKPNTHHYRYEICISIIAYWIDWISSRLKLIYDNSFGTRITRFGSPYWYKLWYNSNARNKYINRLINKSEELKQKKNN